MSYKALYRKYRSKTFDEVYGQEAIITTLKNALITQKISHAYLFSGPRGTGKTSVARLFAKALNCEQGIGKQCNECSSCIAINEGNHPDVIEIDAASNRGVDEIRNLIEKVKYSPIKGRYKVYIIDEVHMMTDQAFNALLKTLEEPPSYVVFILCTTEPYKLLPTILSRCQRFEFTKIANPTLEKLILHVLKEENVTYDEDAIKLLVEISNGGARDALSILDQIIAFSGNHISLKDIESVFGLASTAEKIQLLSYVSTKDTLSLIKFYEKLLARNVDVARLNNELLEMLKDTLIYIKTGSSELLEAITKDDAEHIKMFFNENKVLKMIDLLLNCQNEFKTTSNPSFLFEIYLLKLMDNNVAQEETSVESNPKNLETRVNRNNYVAPTQIQKPVEKQVVKEVKPVEEKKTTSIPVLNKEDLSKLTPLFKENEKKADIEDIKSPIKTEGEHYEINNDTLIKIMVSGSKKAKEELHKRWNYLDMLIDDKQDGAFAALLKDSMPYVVTPKIILIQFNFESQADKFNIKENQAGFARVMQHLVGKKVFLYGLNRKVLNEVTHTYLDLKQVNKLPKPEDLGDIDFDK
ncbi:MAG: DNA polymerase III subunit gamma/tau [Bacilli bacterium]